MLARLASAAVGSETPCAPVIEKPWVRAAPPGAPSLAGYLVLRNPCMSAVEVADVESRDFGMPMIHRTEVVDGVSRMRPAGKLVVPPGGELRFEPGGLHLMPYNILHIIPYMHASAGGPPVVVENFIAEATRLGHCSEIVSTLDYCKGDQGILQERLEQLLHYPH